MSEGPQTFSEHWHRVAEQRLSLRPTVRATRHSAGGEQWWVLQESLNNEFFRISPAAYRFLARLEAPRTVAQAWEVTLESDPEEAPGQEEVLQLLAQLYQANLLCGTLAPDSAALFERAQKRRRLRNRSRLANFMFLQIPLWNPDRFLRRFLPMVRPFLSWAGMGAWLLLVGAAGAIALTRSDALWQQSQGVLAPGNVVLLYGALFGIKAWHELGHAFACRRFGGPVNRFGLMLMILSPLPYVDASASWNFRSRWERIFVAAAGMVAELFLAAVAVFVWAGTGPGTLHSLAYNVIFLSSVTTLLFNANPLLRYDGYYILSDLLGLPNLSSRAAAMLRFLAERYLFGLRQGSAPAQGRREQAILVIYGVLSAIYRVLVFGAIIWFVAHQFLLLGLLIAALCAFNGFVMPLGRLMHYLLKDRRLARQRPRALAVSAGLAAVVLLPIGWLPMPNHFRAFGVLQAEQCTELFVATPGMVETVEARSGEVVRAGQVLLRLRNADLELALAGTQAELAGADARLQRALGQHSEDLKPLAGSKAAIEKHLAQLRGQLAALTIAAPHAGSWASTQTWYAKGRWVARGELLGSVVDTRSFRFTSAVAQGDAAPLFHGDIRGAEVRLAGEAGIPLAVGQVTMIPGEQQWLASPVLGWKGGGSIALRPEDRTGREAAEPFYELRGRVEPVDGVHFLHGRSGTIRCTLTPAPLAAQWWRRLAQAMQNRPAL